jgi:Pyruvate/2-oxoacid:ferredoxin oxidoreductase delta subunit
MGFIEGVFMGHLVGKDLYRKLGKKIDGLTMRAPWNNAFYAILKELYTSDEAEVAAKMPYGIATIDQIAKSTGIETIRLQKILDSLSVKGLVMDLWMKGQYYYTLSPLVIGIFEFTMMRTGEGLNTKEWARLFNDYMHGSDIYYKSNFGNGQRVGPLRTLPYEETISEHVEILDYEKASAIVGDAKMFAVGLCSCRHEKLHLGAKKCDVPLETCTTIGPAAKHMANRGFAKLISKSEMTENLARFKEMGLVICADNVKKDVSFFCFCCGCCCNVLQGISEVGYPNTVVTSSFIAQSDKSQCSSCGSCAAACPIKAISMDVNDNPIIDKEICMGCGVCALNCPGEAMKLMKRSQKVLHPETMFQRIILQCLERGTLHNLIIANPLRVDQKFMHLFLGGFLKLPPVKKALMGEKLRSSFLQFLEKSSAK